MSEFRADQVGSLLRPAIVQDAWRRFLAGELPQPALTAIEDEAILAVLERQRSAGVSVYTDGEFRRAAYMTGLTAAVDGFSTDGAGVKLNWRADPGREVPPEVAGFALPVVTERLRQRRRLAGDEADFMRAHAPGPFKVTLPSPAHFAAGSYRTGVSDRVYPSRSDLSRQLAAILAGEAGSLAREGVGYVQVDSPTYSTWLDSGRLATYSNAGADSRTLFSDAIAGDNAILDAARAGGALTAVHVCRGNASGAWLATGGYEAIAERVFGELRCDRLLLEYDSDRAGSLDPLRLVPAPKVVVLGLISTKYGALESRDDVLRRIEEAARFLPVERLALSPQCGFASNFRGNPLSEDEQWRKLELIASVAAEVWS